MNVEVGTAFRMTEKEAGRNVLGRRKDRKREKGEAGKEERQKQSRQREANCFVVVVVV